MESKRTQSSFKQEESSNFNRTPSKPFRESHLAEATNDLISDSKKVANELYEEGKNKLHEAQDSLIGYSNRLADKVQEKPFISLLIAGGIGYILSLLLRRH